MAVELSFVSYLGAWTGTCGTIWTVFSRCEKMASEQLKTDVKNWLKKEHHRETSPPNWPATFAGVFDKVFGAKHFSWKCFFRSCIASVLSLGILILINASLGREVPEPRFDGLCGLIGWSIVLGTLVSSFFIINLVADYLSLLETRYVIHLMRKCQNQFKVSLFLAVDFIATLLIYSFITILIVVWSFSSDVSLPTENIYAALAILRSAIFFESEIPGIPSLGIFLYSTFFTSVWVWLYVLSGLVARAVWYSGQGFTRLKPFLDIEKKPILALGAISIIITTLIYLVAAPFVLFT